MRIVRARRTPSTSNLRWMCATLALTTLVGCARFSQDGGFGPVASAAHARMGVELAWPRSEDEIAKVDARVATLLQKPLSVEDAVQIALLNNRGLRASFEELGLSEADLVQAGRLPNPRFTLRHASALGLYNVEETLTFNVLALLTTPLEYAAEKKRFAARQDEVVLEVADLASRARIAYYTAVAARDALTYAWQVKSAAETARELAARLASAGNWSRLRAARERLFYAEAMRELDRARLAETLGTSNLLRELGLEGDQALKLADHLPELPASITELPGLERTALVGRVDVERAKRRTEELSRGLKLTRASRFVDVLDVGPTRVLDGTRQSPYQAGYEVSLLIPVFDWGGARTRRAETLYTQSVDHLTQTVVDARADIRNAFARYASAYEIASKQHDDVLFAHTIILKEDTLRYNASQVSVFDLLDDARAQSRGVRQYIEDVRDFWIARSDFDSALLGAPLQGR